MLVLVMSEATTEAPLILLYLAMAEDERMSERIQEQSQCQDDTYRTNLADIGGYSPCRTKFCFKIVLRHPVSIYLTPY